MESDERDIPIWFNGTQRWMAGLTKRTTCDDVIYAILFSSGLHEAEATDNFAIFEKWREVERPLSSRTKILKVWAFWGEEQPNVSLSMRSLNDYFLPGESSLYMRSRRRHKRQSRQRSSRHSPTCKCHDRRSCGECSRLKSLEHLVKLVVSQERKLQDITDHIVDTDRLIEKHEGRIHEHRVQQNGLDYVQDSYLNSHSSESSSSLDSACLSVTTLDLNEARGVFPQSSLAELGEITRMCDQLAHLERRLAIERAKGEELELEVGQLRKERGQEEKEEELKNASVEDARVQLLRAVTSHVTQEYNERMLDRRMETCLAEVQDRTAFLHALQAQLAEVESRLTSNMGKDPVISDNNMQVPPFDHLSSDSEGDVFTPHISPLQAHELPSHPETPGFGHTQNKIRAQQDPASVQKYHQPVEDKNVPESTTVAGLRSSKAVSNGGGSTHSQLPSKSPGKSMTGRGRFARETIRKGVDTKSVSPAQQQQQEQLPERLTGLTGSLIHSETASDSYRANNGNTRSEFPHPNEASQSYFSIQSSSSSPVPSSRITQATTSERIDTDLVNIGAPGPLANAHGSRQSQDKIRNIRNSYRKVAFEPNIHSVIARSSGCPNSTRQSPDWYRPLQESGVNSVGSCGDISRINSVSSTPEIERLGRGGNAKHEISEGQKQQAVQRSTYRRSRSADRDRSHDEGRRSRDKGRDQKLTGHPCYDRKDKSQGQVYSMKIVYHNGLDPSISDNSEFHQQNISKHSREEAAYGPGKDFKLTNGLKPDATSSHPNNGFSPSLAKSGNSPQPTGSGNDSQVSNNTSAQQHSTARLSNKDNRNYKEEVKNCSSSLFEPSKLAHGQNTQIVPNKTQSRTTGFSVRGANQGKLGITANSDTASQGNEDVTAQHGFSVRASGNLHAGPQGMQDFDLKKDTSFAQRVARNSQNKQPPNSSSPSFNRFSAEPQTKTGSLSQDSPLSTTPIRDVSVSQNRQKLHEEMNNTNPPSSVNSNQPSCANGVVTNSSRGALYHILSQKFNASKEKIRLNSMQDVRKSETDSDVRIPHSSDPERNVKQSHSQGPSSKGKGTESAISQQMTNGTSHLQSHKPHMTGATVGVSPSQSTGGGRSFILATSSATPRSPASVINTPDQSNTRVSSDRVTTPPSSHNLPPPASALTGGTTPSHNGMTPYLLNNGENRSLPQSGYTDRIQQQHHSNQQQQKYHNNQQGYQNNQPQMQQQQQRYQQSHGQHQNNLPYNGNNHQHQNNVPYNNKHHQHHHIPHQQQQQLNHLQDGPALNGCNHSEDHVSSTVQGEAAHQPVSHSVPHRRSALNPYFYDINNGGSKKLSSQAVFPNHHNKKPIIVNGSAGLIDYHHEENTNIMSYLQHSNSGFLENLKNNGLPPSMTSSRSTPIATTSTTAVPALSIGMTPSPNSDHFDVSDPRKTKVKMEDSNDSDTGLSSMHSDETANMETLV